MTFEELYQLYWQKVFRLCMGYVNQHDWAKDLAQEVFITVWQQLPKFKAESSVGTWIFRIASNHCLRQIERDQRIPKTKLPKELPEAHLSDKDAEIAYLYKCISELPETDRLIISLELEEVKQADIANILGMSEGNIRVRIHRIKDKLSKKFKHNEREYTSERTVE
ncbi:sigma-70 family RNA polymerase sigma factor [Rapidithrix thailandica]|uniref:Sigma-70 family RNA polymerase sigma factor n=1 Tax=Rapidithrix thailandica TaxID=413964 RepID=A0AAW9SLG1_9BACT